MPDTIPHPRLTQAVESRSCNTATPPAGWGAADDNNSPKSVAADAPAAEKKNKRGAPEKNKNALKHGANCRRDFVVPAAPGKNDYVDRTISAVRRQLETAVIDVHGRISLAAASTINAACRSEWGALIAARWLRDAYDTLDPDQRLTHLARIVQLTAEREKHIGKLGLDRSAGGSVLDILLPPMPDHLPQDDAYQADSADPPQDQ